MKEKEKMKSKLLLAKDKQIISNLDLKILASDDLNLISLGDKKLFILANEIYITGRQSQLTRNNPDSVMSLEQSVMKI